MPQNSQVNAAIHEPNILLNLDAGILANGAYYPQNVFANLGITVPYNTYGWSRLFFTIGADQALTLRAFSGREYIPNIDRLTRVTASDTQNSHVDPLTGVNVISLEVEIATPFVIFDVLNTGGFPTTYLDIYIGLRV